jgi:hypothetical protein
MDFKFIWTYIFISNSWIIDIIFNFQVVDMVCIEIKSEMWN